MKKFLNITALVLCVAVVIGMGVSSLADASINQVSPNRSEVTRTGLYEFEGFVQIKPSYNDNGRHAQYRSLTISSPSSSKVKKAETLVGTHEGDSRLLSDLCTLYMDLAKEGQTDFEIKAYPYTVWQPHTGDPTRPWAHPFSFSPIENLIEPQLMK